MAEYSEKKKLQLAVPNLLASFALLSKYRNQTKRLRNGKDDEPSQLKHLQMEKRNGACSEVGGNASNAQALSAVAIMRMAEMVLSQPTSLTTAGDFSNLANSLGFESGISSRSENHLTHVLRLLDAAEKFSNEEYDEAEELLVSVLSSCAHPIERVITSYALYPRERIDVRKCRIDLKREVQHVDVEEAVIDLKAAVLACEQKLALVQILNFAAIQTILDSVAASAESIHFIDIGRKLFSCWIVMMQALSNRKNCQLKQLKITAVCTLIYGVKEEGELLSSFAESMNLPFVFKSLDREDNELEKVCFEIEASETVAVFMDDTLHCLASCPKNVNLY